MRRFVFFKSLGVTESDYFYATRFKPLYDAHKAKILKQHLKKDELVLTTFDLTAGFIITETYAKNGILLSKTEDKKCEPYIASYDIKEIKRAEESLDKLGKKVVYDFIIAMGKATPGELFGLSIYGESREVYNVYVHHGFDEMDWIRMYREGLDKDRDFASNESGRLFTSDLSKQKMGEDNFLAFRNAFNKNAKNYVFLFYAEHVHINEYNNLIDFLFKTTDGFKKYIYNDSIFDLEKVDFESGNFYKVSDWDSFRSIIRTGYDVKKITGRMIRAFFCLKLKTRYELALAKISGCTTYGLALGAKQYDFLDEKTKVAKLYRGDVTLKNLFYQRYFGFGKADEDTLLLPYSPNFECEIIPVPVKKELFETITESVAHYIFILGIDYKGASVPIDFNKCLLSRIDEIFQPGTSLGDRLVFHCFDFLNGKKKTILSSKEKDGFYTSIETEPDELDTFSVINLSRDYKTSKNEFGEDEKYFVEQKYYLEKSKGYLLTINHVYNLILEHINSIVPTKFPAKIKEISFFTHGDERGPVIYNCGGKPDKNGSEAGPGRGIIYTKSVDPHFSDWFSPLFSSEDTGLRNTDTLRSNLADDALLAIYGCNSNPNYAKLIKAIVESDEYKQQNLNQDSLITLKNPGRELKQFLKKHTNLTKDEQSTPLKLKYRMGDLLLFFRDVLKSSYMLGMAVVTEKPVYGGLPGMNTYMIETDKDRALINVESEFKKHFKFYERHFGFENDRDLVKKRAAVTVGNWFDPDKTGGYAKYVHNFPWFEKEGLEGVNF